MDYDNQRYHAQLDRLLSSDLIDFISFGRVPELSSAEQTGLLSRLENLLPLGYHLEKDVHLDGVWVPGVLHTRDDARLILWPIHTMTVMPQHNIQELAFGTGIEVIPIKQFDIMRRPIWVWNNLIRV